MHAERHDQNAQSRGLRLGGLIAQRHAKIVSVPQHRDGAYAGHRLLEHSQPLGGQLAGNLGNTGNAASRVGKARRQSRLHGIARLGNNDRGIARPLFRGLRRWIAAGDNQVDMLLDELVNQPGKARDITLRRLAQKDDVLVFHIPTAGKSTRHVRAEDILIAWGRGQDTDTIDLGRVGECHSR